MTRPTTVTIAVVVTMVSAILTIIGTIVAAIGAELDHLLAPETLDAMEQAMVAQGATGVAAHDLGAVIVVALALVLAIAIGMLFVSTQVARGHAWARNVLTALIAMDLVASTSGVAFGADLTRWHDLPTLALGILGLWLLWNRSARAYFDANARHPQPALS